MHGGPLRSQKRWPPLIELVQHASRPPRCAWQLLPPHLPQLLGQQQQESRSRMPVLQFASPPDAVIVLERADDLAVDFCLGRCEDSATGDVCRPRAGRVAGRGTHVIEGASPVSFAFSI